jgi:sortase A
VFRITARILLALGLTLLAVFALAQIDSLIARYEAMRSFAASKRKPLASEQYDPSAPAKVNHLLKSGEPVDTSTVLLGHIAHPLAVLRIPKLHLELPVLDGTDELTLNRGVGRIAGTARPGQEGNIGIAGHRDGFFRGLKDVHIGDTVDLFTDDGSYVYVIDQILITNPENLSVLAPGPKSSLTLITCYPFYFVGPAPRRYIVRASLKQHVR